VRRWGPDLYDAARADTTRPFRAGLSRGFLLPWWLACRALRGLRTPARQAGPRPNQWPTLGYDRAAGDRL